MDGYQYEKKCAELLKNKGFSNVNVTQGSGDQGVDVFAEKDGKKWAVQCKYYEGSVGNKAVQEVFAGASFYDCDEALIITNSTLTKQAALLADKLDVKVWENVNAIVLQQETKIAQSKYSYMSQAEKEEYMLKRIEEYLRGEGYEEFLKTNPPNIRIDEEVNSFVNEMTERIKKIHVKLKCITNDESKVAAIESYFENRRQFVELSRYNNWDVNEELKTDLEKILFYPFETDVLFGIEYVLKSHDQIFYSPLSEQYDKYSTLLETIVSDDSFLLASRRELDSIEDLTLRLMSQGKEERASYASMNLLVQLLYQLYNCGVIPITSTSSITHAYYFNFQPFFGDGKVPFWGDYLRYQEVFQTERPIDLAVQGRLQQAKVDRDAVPIDPLTKAEMGEKERLKQLTNKYKANEIVLKDLQEKIDYYNSQALQVIEQLQCEISELEAEKQQHIRELEDYQSTVINKQLDKLGQLNSAMKNLADRREQIRQKLIRNPIFRKPVQIDFNEVSNYLDETTEQVNTETLVLKEMEKNKREKERTIASCDNKIKELQMSIETIKSDLMFAEHKVKFLQIDYDKQKEVLDEIQKEIGSNHKDYLLENYSDVVSGVI